MSDWLVFMGAVVVAVLVIDAVIGWLLRQTERRPK